MRAWRGPAISLALLAALVLLAGCDPDSGSGTNPGGTSVSGPFRGCPAPVTPTSGTASRAPAGSQLLPDLTLPCFVGGSPVALRALGRPAVINLWASWCRPCRLELPHFQQLADSADDQVLVLGVVTEGDTTDAAGSLATELGISFPTVVDTSSRLHKMVAPQTLPVTLLVDANGVVRHVDRSGALTLPELVDLVHQHLGIVVDPRPVAG